MTWCGLEMELSTKLGKWRSRTPFIKWLHTRTTHGRQEIQDSQTNNVGILQIGGTILHLVLYQALSNNACPTKGTIKGPLVRLLSQSYLGKIRDLIGSVIL